MGTEKFNDLISKSSKYLFPYYHNINIDAIFAKKARVLNNDFRNSFIFHDVKRSL